MTKILLVHGTFASGASWTMPGSLFRTQIGCKLKVQEEDVIPIEWSGRNWIADRLIAARKINSTVETLRVASKDEKIFIVGHSHGGSAVSYFLKHFECASAVRGAVFLSTPFIALKAKNNIGHRVKVYSYGMLFLFQAIALFAARNSSNWFNVPDHAFYLVLSINLLLGVALLHMYRSFEFFERLVKRTRLRVKAVLKTHDSCALPVNNYLVVKYSGDEASFGLSFAQSISYFLNWLTELIYGLALKIALKTSRYKFVGQEWFEFFISASVVVWLIFSPTLIGYNLDFEQFERRTQHELEIARTELTTSIANLKSTLADMPPDSDFGPCRGDTSECKRLRENEFSPREEVWRDINSKEQALADLKEDSFESAKFHFINFIGVISILIFRLIQFLCLLFLITYACAIAFGARGITELLFVESSVELVPYGAHKLVHLDWNELGDRSNTLRHSEVYSSPAALEIISNWLGDLV
jgi:pimeloyl-ACP methyl ester carboxylesterase